MATIEEQKQRGERIAGLEAEIAALRARIGRLQEFVLDLSVDFEQEEWEQLVFGLGTVLEPYDLDPVGDDAGASE